MRGLRGGLVPLAGLACLVAAGAGASAPERHTAAGPRNGLIAFGKWVSQKDEDIYVMNPDGTGERALTDQPRADAAPVWSPNGRRIAFFSFRNANGDIYVMNADGSGVRRVTRSPAYDFTPTWSPDGRQIAFMRFPRAEGCHPVDLFAVDAVGTGERRVTRLGCGARNPAWSPDGRTIAFEDSYGIYLVNVDGTDVRRLTHSRYGPDLESEPAWSPDGKRIAYTSAGANTPLGIYLMNADGTGQHRLTRALRESDGAPAWSPDGRKIVFSCSSGPITDICVVNADGSGRLRLTEDGVQNSDPSWQPLPG